MLELRIERVVAGGDGLARDASGRVVLVDGALPGETVTVELTEDKARFARGRVHEILEASPARRTAPCVHVADGCGGCPWQWVTPETQRALKHDIVVDALRHLGKISEPPVNDTIALIDNAYRTTARVLVVGGRPAYRAAQSHDPVAIDHCWISHPSLDDLLAEGRFGSDAHEVELRIGARTGERMVLGDPTAAGIEMPSDVQVVGMDDLEAGHNAWIHEEVAGRRWRISAGAFFQIRPDGADALAELVLAGVKRPEGGMPRNVIDLYAGVGLFAGVAAAAGTMAIAVEGDRWAAADARVNLRNLEARVEEHDVHRWVPEPAEVVVADPARNGLGTRGVAVAVGCAPNRIVAVHCDPAALGRDAALLIAAEYDLTTVTPVDLFPHTTHVETVSVFTRRADK
ncbi:MAG: class I SAM-dependent RNA methyltransferase [Acidimicrobiia bacterium]